MIGSLEGLGKTLNNPWVMGNTSDIKKLFSEKEINRVKSVAIDFFEAVKSKNDGTINKKQFLCNKIKECSKKLLRLAALVTPYVCLIAVVGLVVASGVVGPELLLGIPVFLLLGQLVYRTAAKYEEKMFVKQKLEENIQNYQVAVASRKNEIEALGPELKEKRQKLEEGKEALETLRRDFYKLEKQMKTFSASVEKTDEKDLTREHAEVMYKLQIAIKVVDGAVKEQKAINDSLKQEIAEGEKRIKEYKKLVGTIEEEFEALRKNENEAVDELRKCEEEILSCEERLSEVSTLIATIERDNILLESDKRYLSLEGEKESLESKIETFKQKKAELEEKIEGFKSQFSEVEKRMCKHAIEMDRSPEKFVALDRVIEWKKKEKISEESLESIEKLVQMKYEILKKDFEEKEEEEKGVKKSLYLNSIEKRNVKELRGFSKLVSYQNAQKAS